MSLIYRFPTNVSIDAVTQEYLIQHELFLGEKIMPFREHMTQLVEWFELDKETGMTAAHNLGADPKVNNRPGSVLRRYSPIYFKETDVINEAELLQARNMATLGGVVDMHELIGRTIRAREDKNFIRAEYLRWKALQGVLDVNENGVVVHETFPVQTYDALVPWATHATATPLKDMNAVKLKFRGTGTSAKGAIAYINQKTLNDLLQNANDNDLRGFRSQNFLSLAFSQEELNKIQTARGLPTYEVYDEGYNDDAGDFQTFIPDAVVIVIGKRPAGQVVGDVSMTPSMHRQKSGINAPGMFTIVEVNGQPNRGVAEVSSADLGAGKNPRVDVTGGFYGGPRMLYPRSVVNMDVS